MLLSYESIINFIQPFTSPNMNLARARSAEINISSPNKGSFQQVPLIKSQQALPLINSPEPIKQAYTPYAAQLHYPTNYKFNYATPVYHQPYYPVNYINTSQPINYQYLPYQQYYQTPAAHYVYGNTIGYDHPKPAEKRVTYHPYQQSYIDYEQRVVVVPVEKVQTKYIENIHITEYVPQVRQQVVLETVPVERNYTKVQYIPVQRKIIHFPKDQKLFNQTHQHGSHVRVHTQYKKEHSTPSTLNTSLVEGSFTKQSTVQPDYRHRAQTFRQSPVKRLYPQRDENQQNPEIRILRPV